MTYQDIQEKIRRIRAENPDVADALEFLIRNDQGLQDRVKAIEDLKIQSQIDDISWLL